jgi:protein-disulfide isomerase
MRTDFANAWVEMPRVNLGARPAGAAVVVVKFNDYECPTCRQGEQLYKPLFEQFETTHPGAVRLVSKDYPLNASCNVQLRQTIPGHEAACHAAAAARIARDRGKFDEMTNWIWLNQSTTVDTMRENASRILGLSPAEFDREYLARLPAIRQDIADGAALQITGTPTYFINGVRLPSPIIPVEYFRLAIELELEQNASAPAGAAAEPVNP